MASAAGTRAAALLFSFSGAATVLFFVFLLLQAPPLGGLAADHLVSALGRFLGDGRGLLDMVATRRNMVLLCHAILLLILRDAGVLGAPPGSRRARATTRSPPAAAATSAAVAQTVVVPALPHASASAVIVASQSQTVPVPVPARPSHSHATTRSAVVWRRRRPRSRAAVLAPPMHEHGHDAAAAAGRVVDVECRPAAGLATWATPVLTTGPPPHLPAEEEAAAAVAVAVVTKQIVLVESPRNENDDDDDLMLDHRHGRRRRDRDAGVEQIEHPTAAIAAGCDDRSIVVAVADGDDEKRVGDTAREEQRAAGTEVEMELADNRAFEEFIESQRRKMRQESLRLARSAASSYQYHQAARAATCY